MEFIGQKNQVKNNPKVKSLLINLQFVLFWSVNMIFAFLFEINFS